VSAAAPAPSQLPIHQDPERVGAWPDAGLAEVAAWLAGDRWLDEDAGPPAGYVVEDPELDGPGPAGPGPGGRAPVEVWKAGRWDRSTGDGGGFAAGGAGDYLPPGPVLAGLAGDRWAAGLGQLTDDELIGVLRAGRRLASWAAAMELAAVADLWARRTGEEDAGDAGAAEHADDEIAAALTLTRRAAEGVLGLAVGLARVPAAAAALAGGDIDLPRAKVIVEELTGLGDAHAAAVEAAIIGAAAGLTTGQLRAATHRAVLAADPGAARQRKEQALREARVERWSEPAGTAALAGRDLPPAQVLAADANLTALARQLKAAGGEGTLDTLRAQIYLALLTGTPAASLLPTTRGASGEEASDRESSGRESSGRESSGRESSGRESSGRESSGRESSGRESSGRESSGRGTSSEPDLDAAPVAAAVSRRTAALSGSYPGLGAFAPAGASPGLGAFGAAGALGRVNLTMPLATWLGRSDVPGQVAGYGPLDATDSRALADALAAHAGTKWCLTITGPDGRPVAHGCARTGPPAGTRDRPGAGSRDGPPAGSRDRPGAGSRDGPPGGYCDHPGTGSRDGPPARDRPSTGSRGGPKARARGRPPARSPAWTWTFTVTPLDGGRCDHAWETPAYRPSDALRHQVNIRHAACVFPGCRRPAAQCDADHTIAYECGGPTCLCNLAPLCRHHHQTKQAAGWALEQTSPGTMTWTTPSGRRYITAPTSYSE
jgi:hypothetical protein